MYFFLKNNIIRNYGIMILNRNNTYERGMHPMSDFSDMLTYLIHSKNIKVASMAQYCNIDRANMYKNYKWKKKSFFIGFG